MCLYLKDGKIIMKYTELGRSGITACIAPLGTLHLGSARDRETSFAILDAYVASGGDLLDTANSYDHWRSKKKIGGESETVIGEWLAARGNRDKVKITSKVGFDYEDVPDGLAKKIIKTECEKSLKRLGVETIDVYLAHKDDPDTPQEEVLSAFAELIAEGKIRTIGASNFLTHRLVSANCFARANGLPEYQVLEQRYTYLQLRRDADMARQQALTPDLINYCRAAEMSIIAYSVALGGSYFTPLDEPLPDVRYNNAANQERRVALQEIANETGSNPQQIMYAWMFAQQGIRPLVAGETVAQLEENLAALEIELSDDQLARLDLAGA